MALMPWSNQLSVGHSDIDSQHQKLVQYVNELHDAMMSGKGDTVMAPILDRLVDYTKNHFGFEERVMTQIKYPGAAGHLEEHRKLAEQVLQFQANFKAGKATVTMDLMKFLKNWLLDHIMRRDKELSAFIAKKSA